MNDAKRIISVAVAWATATALTHPADRVAYTPLSPRKPDFDKVRDLMMESGVLDRKIEFEEYVDTRFAETAEFQSAWLFEAGSDTAE